MNEKYLKGAYTHLKIEDDYASWLQDTMSDEGKLQQLYSDLDVTDHEYDVWKDAIFGGATVKKKDPSPSLDGELQPKDEVAEQGDGTIEALFQGVKPGSFDFLLPNQLKGAAALYRARQSAIKKNAGLKYDYLDYDFGDVDADELASSAQLLLDQNSQKIYDRAVQSEEYLDAKAKIGKMLPGQIRTVSTAAIGAPSYVGQETYEEAITEDDIEKAKSDALSKAFNSEHDKFVKSEVKEMVLNALPEDKRGDKELVAMLTDKIFYEKEIATDLDGNGRYNNNTIVENAFHNLFGGMEAISQPLMYAVASPFMDADERKKYRQEVADYNEQAASLLMTTEKGISASVANGDIYNAFRLTVDGIAQTAPIIGVTTAGAAIGTPYLGAAAVGLSGGVGAYMEVADDKSFKNNAYKYGYAFANGVGDFSFAAIGSTIFGAASKAAAANYAAAQVARGTSKKITADMVKGYAQRKGIAMASEAAEEAATEITTYVIEQKGRGKDLDMSQLFERAIDAAIIGGVAGSIFDSLGGIDGRVRAASNAEADSRQAALVEALRQKVEIEKKIREAKDPTTAEGLKRELQRVSADIEDQSKMAKPFYEMLAVRYPEALDAVQKLDVQIAQIRSQIKSGNLGDDSVKNLEGLLEKRVKERVDLEAGFREESLSLSAEEKSRLTDKRVRDRVTSLDEEIAQAQEALAEVEKFGGMRPEGADPEALRIARERVEELKAERQSVNKLIGQTQQARNKANQAIGKALSEDVDLESLDLQLEQLQAAEEALAEALGVDPVETQSGTVGELLDMNREIQDRATEEWTQRAIEDLNSSELTSDEIQAIFDSDNFAMLTAENPNARAVGEKANAALNKKAVAWLKSKGLKFHKIVGRYGNGENSFLVEGMTKDQAAEFASEFNQESVAHKEGLVLGDGSIQLFGKEVGDASDSNNYFSAIKNKEGEVRKFGMDLTDTYQDVDGNEITADEYKSRIESIASSVDQIIEQAVKEEPAAEAVVEDTPAVEQDAKMAKREYESDEGGNFGVREGDAGLNTAEAKAVNGLMKVLSTALGQKVRLVLYDDAASSEKSISEGGMGLGEGGQYADGVVYLSPEVVRKNAELDGQGPDGLRTKTFTETLIEEVAHGVVEPAFQKLPIQQQRDLIAKLKKDVFGNDEALLVRVEEKRKVYEQNQKNLTESDLLGEELMELFSALSGDKGVEISLINRARLIFNEILTKAFGRNGAKFHVSDVNSFIKAAAAMKAARDGGVRAQRQSASVKTRKSSRGLSPASLRAKDGNLTVKFHRKIYKRYGFGEKPKDIGDYPDTKTFTDQWHFINWWKKSTSIGENRDVFDFTTEDGQPIDVDRIKTYGRKSSGALRQGPMGTIDNMKSRLDAAESAGVVNPIIANRMRSKFRTLERKMARQEPGSKMYASIEKIVNDIDQKSKDMIDQISKRDGKEFSFEADDTERKSSRALKMEVRNSAEKGSKLNVIKALNDIYGGHFKGQAAVNSMLSRFMREEAGVDISSFTDRNGRVDYDGLFEIAAPVFNELMGANYKSKEERTRIFGEKDPIEFFENNNRATDEDLDLMEAEGVFIESRAENRVAYNLIKAITSQMNLAKTNMAAASNIFFASAQYRDRGGNKYIDPRIIYDLRTGENTSGVDLTGVNSVAAASVANNLEKLNNLADDHRRGSGSVNFGKMFDGLQEFQGPTDSLVGRTYVAQSTFGAKIGTFALNLNGNEDAITLDSHNLKTLTAFSNMYSDPVDQLASVQDQIAEEVGMEPVAYSNAESERAHTKKLLMALKAKMMNSTGDTKQFNRLKRLFDKAMAKKVNSPAPGSSKRMYFEKMILSVSKSMGISPAQANQLVFADSQVTSRDIKELDPSQPMTSRRYQEFSEFSKMYSQQRSWKNSSAARQSALTYVDIEAQNEIEARDEAYDNPQDPTPMATADADRKSSGQLRMPFDAKQDAVDSPLYRTRTAQEGLMVKPGVMISEKMSREALATDATSRRIMAKNTQMAEGQKVGVRLNLNVNKNTGVPVQTMHDKNASGEALKYAAVVTVSNPVLDVNQNSRRKILTFQENKNPMASVNGGFVSDQVSDANFNGVKAFFNPFKHNVFVDAQGRPIKSAGEATVVGNTVYLRGDIEYYDFNDPILTEGREETAEQRAKRVKRGPKYDKALVRYQAYAKRVLGIEFGSIEEVQESYDNMPITSQVAMNESEVAANAEEAERRSSGGLRLRQYASKAAKTYIGARSEIVNNPESYYSRQNLADIKNSLVNMSDQQLVDKMTDDGLGRLQNRNDDIGVLATSELIRRAAARGDDKAIADLVEEASKIGTSAGRILRHFRELRQSTPLGLFSIIQSEIEKRGNKMTADQSAKLKDLTERLFLLQSEHQDLVNRAIQGEDVESDLKAKTKEVLATEKELDIFNNSMIEKGWGELGRQLIQGNLLTTISQVANIGYNVVNAIAKVGVDAIALPVERLINLVGIESPIKRRYSVGAYLFGLRKFGAGFVEALDEVATGQTKDVTEWRMSRGFAPLQSMLAVLGKGDLPIRQDNETVPFSQKAKLLVQSTFGLPAEAMFRLLAIGDTPFRRMVEGIELYQAGMAQGLEGEQLKRFVKHPTKKEQDRAEQEGRRLTFQERTGASESAEKLVRGIQDIAAKALDWIPGIDAKSASEFIIRATVPYVRTPANILLDTLTFVSPYVAIPRMMNDLRNGDARAASQNFGKLAVGTMAAQTARILIQEGLVSGALEFDDDDEKRNLSYDKFPPSSINVSGLQRWMEGGDTSLQEDDYFIQYSKLGVVGTIIGAIERSTDREAEIPDSVLPAVTDALGNAFGMGAFSSVSYMLDQSFLQGINGLLQTVASSDSQDFQRNFERWFGSVFQAASATVLPNQLSAFYRADREYLPDTRITKDMEFAERIAKKMAYTINDRTFNLGDVPVRVNWKGEKIEQAPRGANAVSYQLFDIFKARQGSADPISNEVYRLYEQTEDIPKIVGTPNFASTRPVSVPDMSSKMRRYSKEYSFLRDEEFTDERLRLNTAQMNRLMESAGKDRYMRVEEFMASSKYERLNDEEKIEALNDLNSKYYSKAISFDRGRLMPHSEELLKIIQEIYDYERREED